MTASEIEVDEDVMQSVIDGINKYADHLDELTKAGVAEYSQMHDQLKGDGGTIPPIYASIAEALSNTAKKFVSVNAAVTSQLRADAAVLHKIVTTHGDIQREAAAQFDRVVGSFSGADGAPSGGARTPSRGMHGGDVPDTGGGAGAPVTGNGPEPTGSAAVLASDTIANPPSEN